MKRKLRARLADAAAKWQRKPAEDPAGKELTTMSETVTSATESEGVEPRALPPAVAYTPTRCAAFFGVWVVAGVAFNAPAGWTCTRTATGRYEIRPNAADVRDVYRSVALAAVLWSDLDTPAARVLTVVTGPDKYVVTVVDSTAAPADTPFGLMVLAG